jgi:cell division GTPase FtsZ
MAFPTPTGEALIPGGDGDLSVGVYRLGLIGAGRAGVNLVDAFYRTGWHHGVGIAADPDAFEDKALDAKARIRLGTPSEGTGMRGVERVIGDQQFAIASALVDAFGSDRELILIAAGLGGVTGVGSVPALLEVLKEVSAATRRDERPPPPVGMLLSVTPRRLLAEEGRVSAAEEGVQTLRRLHDGGKLRPFILVEPDRLREFVPGEDVAARRMRDATVAGACDAVNRLPLLRPLRGEVDADAFRKAVEGEGLSSIGLSAATGTSAADLEGAVRHALGKGWLCGAVAPSRGLVAAVVVVIGSEDLAGDAGTLSRLESAVGIAKGILPQARLSTGIYEDDGKGVRIIAWVGGLPFPESLVS